MGGGSCDVKIEIIWDCSDGVLLLKSYNQDRPIGCLKILPSSRQDGSTSKTLHYLSLLIDECRSTRFKDLGHRQSYAQEVAQACNAISHGWLRNVISTITANQRRSLNDISPIYTALMFQDVRRASSSTVQWQPPEYRWWGIAFLPTHVAQEIERVVFKRHACLDEGSVLHIIRSGKFWKSAHILCRGRYLLSLSLPS